MSTVIVLAKQCLPGRVKTRLTPPLTPEGAAQVASVMLDLTLHAVEATSATRRVLFFDGSEPPAAAAGWEVLQQPAGDLDVRIGAAFDAVDGRAVLIGMDTPHLDPATLDAALHDEGADAWFGPTTDGGFWALALDSPRGDLVRGVPMSRADTGPRQRARLRAAGLRVGDLPTLTDVDTIADAGAVAAMDPQGALARTLARAPRHRSTAPIGAPDTPVSRTGSGAVMTRAASFG